MRRIEAPAHGDPERRFVAAAAGGVAYVLLGLFSGVLVGVLAGLPPELVLALAAIALVGTMGSALGGAMSDPAQRETAVVTFLATLSGISASIRCRSWCRAPFSAFRMGGKATPRSACIADRSTRLSSRRLDRLCEGTLDKGLATQSAPSRCPVAKHSERPETETRSDLEALSDAPTPRDAPD